MIPLPILTSAKDSEDPPNPPKIAPKSNKNQVKIRKHHKRKHRSGERPYNPGERPYQPPMFQNYSDGEYKCYYEPSAKKKLSCQQALSSCPIKYHPQRDKYILKSEIPPMPNMEDYVLKSAIPPAECPPTYIKFGLILYEFPSA